MLLSQLSPKDVRQLFICHKQLFYSQYERYPEAKKDYVVECLKNEYQVDKVGARKALFGHDAPMEETPGVVPEPAPPGRARDDMEDLINRVGPWGPIRKG